MKEYKLISNFAIETSPDKIELIIEHLTYAFIDIAEEHDSFIGGGFNYKLIEN